MYKVKYSRVVLAGLAATVAMTLAMQVAPTVDLPTLDVGRMLGEWLLIGTLLGWMVHFLIGLGLAWVYAAFFAGRLRGPLLARGMLFSLGPWLVMMLVVLPLVHQGAFDDSWRVSGVALLGHLIYGAALGAIYGRADTLLPADLAGTSHPTHA